MTLADAARGHQHRIARVGGSRAFRRRLMELGLVPGTAVEIVGVAPLGDPIELLVRGCSLSIRRAEAAQVAVEEPAAGAAAACASGCRGCAAERRS